jgi:hypothetical protein
VARVFSGSDRVEFDRIAEHVEVIAISGPSLHHRTTYDVCGPKRRLHSTNGMPDAQCRLDDPSRAHHLQSYQIAGVELAARFERNGGTRHVRQVWEEELHALSSMSTVIGILVDMDNDESGNGESGDDLDELPAAFCAAAVPMKLGFTDAQVCHGLAYLGDVVVFA